MMTTKLQINYLNKKTIGHMKHALTSLRQWIINNNIFMKKILFGWMAIMLVAIVSVSIVACGDDDDDSDSNAVTGTWKGQGFSYDDDEQVTIVFRGNNTGTFTLSTYDSYYKDYDIDKEEFTYELYEDGKSGRMEVKYIDEDDYGDGYEIERYYFWLEDNILYVDDNELYGTPEWVLTKK